MTNFSFQNKRYFLFLALIAGLAAVCSVKLQIAITKTAELSSLSIFVNLLLTITLFFFILNLFDKYIWRVKIFKALGITEQPYFGGRWVGFLASSYQIDGQNTIVPVTLEIKQTSSALLISAYFKKGNSTSFIADFKTINGESYLCYVYDNTLAKDGASHDRGTVILKPMIKNNKRILKGNYFNDLKPQSNHGEIQVTYSGSKLLHQT